LLLHNAYTMWEYVLEKSWLTHEILIINDYLYKCMELQICFVFMVLEADSSP
jgi:hypothetical protein